MSKLKWHQLTSMVLTSHVSNGLTRRRWHSGVLLALVDHLAGGMIQQTGGVRKINESRVIHDKLIFLCTLDGLQPEAEKSCHIFLGSHNLMCMCVLSRFCYCERTRYTQGGKAEGK